MIRLLHFVVQPVLVSDEGEELTQVPPVSPQVLTLTQLAALVQDWPTHLAGLTEHIEKSDPRS